MNFKTLTAAELDKLQFTQRGRSNGGASQYTALLDEVKKGKPVLVPVEAGKKPKTVAQAIYSAAKASKVEVSIRTLADMSGVVVTLKPEEPTLPGTK